MTTTKEAVASTGLAVFDELTHDQEVPRIDRGFLQGDVSVLRADQLDPATNPIPAAGVVVQSGNGGHDHTLFGPGFYSPGNPDSTMTMLGTLTVPDGATVLLGHNEHGYAEVMPGTYRVGGQREFAAEWRQVAD